MNRRCRVGRRTVGSLVVVGGLLFSISGCSSGKAAETEAELPVSTLAPSTTVAPTTTSTSVAPTTTTLRPGSFVGDGFAMVLPEGWTRIDQQSVDDGTFVERLPEGTPADTVEQLRNANSSGVLLAMYDLRTINVDYVSNVTMRRQPLADGDRAVQRDNTVVDLSSRGFDVTGSALGRVEAGEMIVLDYTIPTGHLGAATDLFVRSHIILGKTATWYFTGVTSAEPEAVKAVVEGISSTFVELEA